MPPVADDRTTSPLPQPSRAVTWRSLLLASLLLMLVMSGLAAGGAYWAWTHLAAQVALPPQTADVTLPPALAIRATLSNKVQVQVNQDLHVRVPIRETLSIPLHDPIEIEATINTTVPIDLDIPIEHVLKVDQAIDLDTQVKTRVLGFAVTLPVKGRVPLRADVPISLVVPVRQRVPVSLTTPVVIRIHEPLQARVDTVLDTRIPIRESFSLPVTAPVNATLNFPQQRVTAGLQSMNVRLPLKAITLSPAAPVASAAAPASAASR